jgi:hypothetical protein
MHKSIGINCAQIVYSTGQKAVSFLTQVDSQSWYNSLQQRSLCVEHRTYTQRYGLFVSSLYTGIFASFNSVKSHIIPTIHKPYYCYYYLYIERRG